MYAIRSYYGTKAGAADTHTNRLAQVLLEHLLGGDARALPVDLELGRDGVGLKVGIGGPFERERIEDVAADKKESVAVQVAFGEAADAFVQFVADLDDGA